ncbi:MAG: transposase [bacterium]
MELWHILNRGVDGRNLFLDSQDYVRFIHNLYQFNDSAPASQSVRRSSPDSHVGFRKPNIQQERDQIVNIHGWVLMKNHYHLLFSERVEGGITLFLRKLNIGYANYFNERYERIGTLFQGRTKKILVERHEHALYLLHYIHLNPLDYLKGAQDWRVRSKGGVRNTHEALEYLDSYRWSSYLDYCKKKNFPSILTTSFFKGMLDDPHKATKEYLRDTEHNDEVLKLTFE